MLAHSIHLHNGYDSVRYLYVSRQTIILVMLYGFTELSRKTFSYLTLCKTYKLFFGNSDSNTGQLQTSTNPALAPVVQ